MIKSTKPFLIGVFSTVAFFGAIAAVERPAATPPTAVTTGRFQISGCGEQNTSTAYLVDTATGEVWHDGQAGFYDVKVPATQP